MGDNQELRQIAAMVGEITGQPEMAQAVMEGRLSANDSVPLFAGMLDGMVQNVFGPLVRVKELSMSEPHERPMVARMKMNDGTILRVTMVAE